MYQRMVFTFLGFGPGQNRTRSRHSFLGRNCWSLEEELDGPN